MALTDYGVALLWLSAVNALPIPFDSAHVQLGVGDGTLPETLTNVALGGAHPKVVKSMDAGFPQWPGGWHVFVFQATFGPTEANFDWNEWGLLSSAYGPSQDNCLVRRLEYQGTKQAGQTWVLRATITADSVL